MATTMLPTPDSSQKEEPIDALISQTPQTTHEPVEIDIPDSQCHHLLALWKDGPAKEDLLKKYKTLVSFGLSRYRNGSPITKKRKLATPRCSQCNIVLVRPLVCLHCSFAGCWKDGHIVEHLKRFRHSFCVDIKSGNTFCSLCDDMILSQTLKLLYYKTNSSVVEKHIHFRDPKKGREAYTEWSPSGEEQDALSRETSAVSCQSRRGLLNLGQTCAMNTVLQAFVHNPLLRNYFLSDKHNYKLCKNKDCMCCEMDKLFAEIFSEEVTPYGPFTFLPVLWRSNSSFSEGYAQHDAHEVFMTCLSQIHTNSKGSTNVSCNCIIHSIFAGSLSSEVKCGKVSCEHVSVKVDPMLDVSLELRGKGMAEDAAENTLAACLRRYTKPEKLSPKEYTCSKCGSNSGATKSLSISKLPPVLAFQLKRFGHKSADRSTAQKINTPIRFPSTLNMFPYTSIGINGSGKEAAPESIYEYDLFCVINHDGAIDNGHYTNYARYTDEWYRFDDDKVTHATLSQVLSSTAYLLFYVKRHLDYRPNVRPSYVITRETEALREKQREREKELKLNQEIDDELMSIL